MNPPTTAADQKQFFEDQGYLVVENLLSPSELEECRHEIRRLDGIAADVERIDEHTFLAFFQREPYASGANNEDGFPVLRKIEWTHLFSPLFERLASHAKLIPVVQNLLDRDLLLFRSTLMLKP